MWPGEDSGTLVLQRGTPRAPPKPAQAQPGSWGQSWEDADDLRLPWWPLELRLCSRGPARSGRPEAWGRAHLAGTAALSWGLSLLPTRMSRCERGGISIWLVYRKGDTEPGLQLQPALVLPRTDPVLLLPTGDW